MSSKADIPLHGSSVNIVRQCGAALSDILQSKFGCVASIEGLDLDGAPGFAQQKRPTLAPEKRFEVRLDAGVLVSVWKADLADAHVDAVVNAANCSLQHYGGLAQALSTAGGPQIQKECDDFIKRYGKLKTGDAIITNAGSLPCNVIIHAVGPQLSIHPSNNQVSQTEPFLRKTITSILDRVKERSLKTVAIPAISSGLFHYPLAQCAHAIVTAMKQYYDRSSGYHPAEILLVNHDEPTVREMERACHQILAPHVTYSQAAAGKSKGDAKMSTPTVQIENVHLTLKRGYIQDQQTDVIVNTTYNRNLSEGEISKALLQKAGPGLQQEMITAYMNGYVIITKAYNLQCKEVYHMCWSEKGGDQMEQILFKSVTQCLWLAVSDHHKSITFPAIGTGGLRINRKEVARIMSNAVAEFSLNFPKKTEVYFVIYPSDNETFEAFEEQMGYLQKSSELNFTHALDHHDSRASTPHISLSGPSEEATRDAQRWLQDHLFKSLETVVMCNNFILHFGEQEHLQLSRLMKNGISIAEFFERGRASIIVDGDSNEDVVVAGLQVEAMLCNIQREFVREERAMMLMLTPDVSFKREPVEYRSTEFSDRTSAFSRTGLRTVKVETVRNATLGILFDCKKIQLHPSTTRRMFQRIPAQFCDMVSHIGFHAEYAPPDDPAYGDGIYFTSTVKKALEVWKEPHWEYLYFVEAEVLTGASTLGTPGLILPPAVGTDPQIMYDSVSGGPEISVIFSGFQALPMYIITCKVQKD